jgi:hypothetical protein
MVHYTLGNLEVLINVRIPKYAFVSIANTKKAKNKMGTSLLLPCMAKSI